MPPVLFNFSTTGNCREIPQVSSQLRLSHVCLSLPFPPRVPQRQSSPKNQRHLLPFKAEARSQEPIHRLPATRGHCGAGRDGCKALQLPPRQALKDFLGFMETEPWRKQHSSEKQKQPMSFTTPRFYTLPEATFLRALQQCDLATHQTDDHSIHLSLSYNQAHCHLG